MNRVGVIQSFSEDCDSRESVGIQERHIGELSSSLALGLSLGEVEWNGVRDESDVMLIDNARGSGRIVSKGSCVC